MNIKQQIFSYDTLTAFSASYYKGLLTAAHQIGDRRSINLGSKEEPDEHVFYIYRMENKLYALPEEQASDLPILITETLRKKNYRDVLDIVKSYKSAKFRPEKKMSFREMVDDLCCFEHSNPKDYALWKIMAFTALIGRTVFRVCTEPGFGKGSVLKVLGFLTSDVCVIANPTTAKLEYRLVGNKVLMLNEFANLKAEDRYGLEHFLQAVGDLSPIYEKRSRAGVGTNETFDISELSLVCAYNNLECYPDEDKYFDAVFSQQTKDRFLPVRLQGRISQQIEHVPDPHLVAEQNSEYLQGVIRTITHYKHHWRDELRGKRDWNVKSAKDYGFTGRWANNYDRIREFVLLYAETPEEAQQLLNILYNRHVEYLQQFNSGNSLSNHYKPRESEELVVIEEDVVV